MPCSYEGPSDSPGSRISGVGVAIEKSGDDCLLRVQKRLYFYVDECVADYLALLDGLSVAIQNDVRRVYAFTDSEALHNQEIAIRNLDYILTVSAHSFIGLPLDILVDLEKQLDLKSSEPWSCRRLPTPTATFPAIINSEEHDDESDFLRTRNDGTKRSTNKKDLVQRFDGFLQTNDPAIESVDKQIRALRKKLQQKLVCNSFL